MRRLLVAFCMWRARRALERAVAARFVATVVTVDPIMRARTTAARARERAHLWETNARDWERLARDVEAL